MTRFDPVNGDPLFTTASRVEYFCLWCNQGMANLIEVYDRDGDQDIPAALVLIDFGAGLIRSTAKVPMKYAPAIFFIIERLRRLVDAGRPPILNRVIISHQDSDHLSMIRVLLAECERQTIPLRIGEVRWGGGNWGPSAEAVLTDLARFTDTVTPWEGTYSDYIPAFRRKRALYYAGNVAFRTLVVNAPITGSEPDIFRNGTGAVIVVEFGGVGTMVLPGDATTDTLIWATRRMTNWALRTGTEAVRPCYVLSAPHHGAQRTILDRDGSLSTASQFTDLVRPDSVMFSAGAENNHKHPYLSVMGVLSQFAGQGGLRNSQNQPYTHPIVFWNGGISRWERLVVLGNVYTTVLQLGLPVYVGDFQFVMNAGQTVFAQMHEFNAPTRESQEINVLMQVDVPPEPPPATVPADPPTLRPVTRVTARRVVAGG